MNTEVKIIVSLSTALGFAALAIIGQNEQITKLEEKCRRKDAATKIYMKAFGRAVGVMNDEQLVVAMNILNDEKKFYTIVRDII